MKTYLIAALLIAATVTPVVAAETFVAPVTPKQQRHRPPPPISQKPDIDGVVPRAVRGGNPLQMLNPRAPRKYGTSQEAIVFDMTDVYHRFKWKGIKFFEFRF